MLTFFHPLIVSSTLPNSNAICHVQIVFVPANHSNSISQMGQIAPPSSPILPLLTSSKGFSEASGQLKAVFFPSLLSQKGKMCKMQTEEKESKRKCSRRNSLRQSRWRKISTHLGGSKKEERYV